MSRVKDMALGSSGELKIGWARSYMPVLGGIEERFSRERPFNGMKIAMSIHLEAKTACLALALRAGGAQVSVTGCNPLSTQDDVAAALACRGFEVYAVRGVNEAEYEADLRSALSCGPDLIVDDGGDFAALLHGVCSDLAPRVKGGCEETTTGVARLRARHRAGRLNFPMIAVNDANCKRLFDNRFGTGQSVWDGIMHATNLTIAGKDVVVAGYGLCGRGIALRAKGLGARVIVTETDPVRAIEAAMEGYSVMTMDQAAAVGDIFVTATGCRDVIVGRHFERMKDGALLANAGHFDVEINKQDLFSLAVEVFERRENIKGCRMKDGRVLNLLADGRLANLAAGNGHPVEIMDMSFSLQALCLEHIAKGGATEPGVYPVPEWIDNEVARRKLISMGISIDRLTREQEEYLFGA